MTLAISAEVEALEDVETIQYKMIKGMKKEIHPKEAKALEKEGRVRITRWPYDKHESVKDLEKRIQNLESQKAAKTMTTKTAHTK